MLAAQQATINHRAFALTVQLDGNPSSEYFPRVPARSRPRLRSWVHRTIDVITPDFRTLRLAPRSTMAIELARTQALPGHGASSISVLEPRGRRCRADRRSLV